MKGKKNINIKGIIIIVAFIAAIIYGFIYDKDFEKIFSDFENVEENRNLELDEYKVVRVVDGDTIVVLYNNKEEKVRLIGIDTPESVHSDSSKNTEEGKEISKYTKQRLEGKNVKLEFDVQERDKYGRLLAYVYIDDIMYNKELLEKGYAKIATYPPNVKYVDEFKEIQKKARENKQGLWE